MAVAAASILQTSLLLAFLLHLLHATNSLSDENLGRAIRHIKQQKPTNQRADVFKNNNNKTHINEHLPGTLPQYNFVLDRIPNNRHEGGVVGFLNQLQTASIARGLQVKDIDNLLRPLADNVENPSDLIIIRDFLSIPRLREILGPYFKHSDHETNADLLWDILANALNSEEVQNDSELFNAIKNNLKNILEFGEDFLVLDDDLFDRLSGTWIRKPHNALLDILLHAMCQYSNDPEKLETLRQIFNRPKDSILGKNFNLYNYTTVGDLFEAVLLNALKSDEMKDDSELDSKLKFYVEKFPTRTDEPKITLRALPEFDPDVEFLLSALNECAKDDSKKYYIRELLSNPHLKDILGVDFNPSEAATNGALLRAILLQSLRSKEVTANSGLFDAILFFVNKIQLEGDACKAIDANFFTKFINSRHALGNSNIDTALTALNFYFQDAAKISPIRNFLNRATLTLILGQHFDSTYYSTLGELTSAILERVLASPEVKGNAELHNAILYYVNKTQNNFNRRRQFTYKLDSLLSALHIQLNESIISPLGALLNSSQINDILGPEFDPVQFKTPDDLLENILLKAKRSPEVQTNSALKSSIEIILSRLKDGRKTYPSLFQNSTIITSRQAGEEVPIFNITTITEVLRHYYDDEAKLELISTLLSNYTTLYKILDVNFNPKLYNTTNMFLQNLFSLILTSGHIKNDTNLQEVIKFYLEKIKEEIDGNIVPNNFYSDLEPESLLTIPDPTVMIRKSDGNTDPDIEYLLSALGKYSKESPEKLQQLRGFLNMPNVTKIMGSHFSYSKYPTNSELLNAILVQALKNKDVKRNKALSDTLKHYVDKLKPASKNLFEGTTYPAVDFLLRALVNQNNSKLPYIYDFLRNPDLSNILGPTFNSHHYFTNGQLLTAIISYALKSSHVQKSANLLKALRQAQTEITLNEEGNWLIGPEFFYKLKNYVRVDSQKIAQYPHIEILLKALAPESKNDTKLPYLFNFLTSPDLYKILGVEFNPHMYATNGELLKGILNFALNSAYVQRDKFLLNILQKFFESIILYGVGSFPTDATFFYKLQLKKIENGILREEEQKYPYINTLLSALDIHAKDNPNLAHLFEFLVSPNKTEILGPRFQYDEYSTNGELLRGILKHAAESEDLKNNPELHKAVTYFANKVDLEKSGNKTLEKDFYHKLTRRSRETYEVYPNIEYLLNALRTSLKSGTEYENLLNFLTKSDLHTAFKPGFNYKKYKTNGELLEAIMKYAALSHGSFEHLFHGLKTDNNGRLPVEPEFFVHLQRKEHREYNPFMDYLLFSALGSDAKTYVKPLREFLSDPEVILHLGGIQFDAYPTMGELLRAILKRATHIERVMEDPMLYNIVQETLNRILVGGNSSRPSDYGPDDYPVTFDVNALILALDTVAMYRDNLGEVVHNVGKFLRDEFRPLMHLINFPFDVFRTRGEFLKGLFDHLLATGKLSEKAKETLEKSLHYIKMSGLGSAPVDYVPFVIE